MVVDDRNQQKEREREREIHRQINEQQERKCMPVGVCVPYLGGIVEFVYLFF